MLIEPLGLQTPIAGFNGGIFVEPDMTIIEEHVLPPMSQGGAVDLMLASRVGCLGLQWQTTGSSAIQRRPMSRASNGRSSLRRPSSATSGGRLDQAVKIVGVSDDLDLVARCETDAQGAFGAHGLGSALAALLP